MVASESGDAAECDEHRSSDKNLTLAFLRKGVVVWPVISETAKIDLVVIAGILNGQCYINKVLTLHLLPFLRQMPVAAISASGASRCHF